MTQTNNAPSLSASQEDYLEAILLQVRQNKVARVRDIANQLGVGMPSVTSALKSLSKQKLVNYDPYQFVTLTDRGLQLAEDVTRRHGQLRRFLVDVLGIDPAVAEANACRIEHAMDEQVLERLRLLAEFVSRCPRAGEQWVEAFQHQYVQGQCAEGEACRECLAGAVRQFRSSDK